MQKQVTQNSHTATTQYMGGYQYSNTRLQFFPTAEGYVKNTIIQGQNSYDYIYNLTDHLGNIRMSFGLDPKTQQLVKFEENNYYPFGLKHSRYNDQLREITEKQSYNIQLEDIITEKRSAQKTLAIPSNPDAEDIVLENSGYQYKYNGKEFQDELGLNMTAMDWRQYDPAIGKWVVQDPITHFDVSPYNAFNNNPVLFADPSGLEGMLSQLTHQSTDLLNKWGYGFEQSANNSSPFQGHLMTHRNPESKEQKGNNKYVFPEGDLRWNDWNSSSEVFRIVSNNTAHVYYASWFISKTGAAQGNGGGYDWAKDLQTGMGAFDVGSGAKGALIDYAVSGYTGKAMNALKDADYVTTLGKTGASYAKTFSRLGKLSFGVSTLISGGLATNYYMNGGTNSSVGIKAGFDIIMGGVGFLGPIGFGVSATYFLLDAGGAFGSYGDPLLTPIR